jgi:peroxiredoxin
VKSTARVFATSVVFAVLSGATALALAIGDAMPAANANLVNVDGRELSLAKVAGEKGTLVIFSCNHCPWVKAWEGRMVEIGNAYRTKGVGIIAVNSNDPKAYPDDDLPQMKERARAKNYLFPYVVDTTSEVARAFGATHTPETFLFDASGRLVYHGTIDDNARDAGKVQHTYLRDALDAVLEGKSPAVQETKALGCTIVPRKQV